MKMPIRIPGVLVCCVLSINAFSQTDFRPGYIIKNNQDSIPGFVSYRSASSNSKQCFFKESAKHNTVAYTADELNGYGFPSDKVYRSIDIRVDLKQQSAQQSEIPNGKVFVQVLTTGPLSLYKYRKFFFLDKDGLILLPPPTEKVVDTNEGRVIKLNRQYIEIINSFTEHAGISANRSAYAEDALTDVIDRYNESQGHRVVKINLKPSFAFHAGLFGSYTKSKMKMDWSGDVSFSPSSTVMGGAFVDISSPKVYDRIFLSVEAWYGKIFYQGYTEYPSSGNLVRQDILVDVSYIKMPIGLKYNLFGLNNTPYVKAGVAFYFLDETVFTIRQETEHSGGIVVTDAGAGEEYGVRNPRSLWFSVGYDRNVFRRLKMFGEIRVERNNGFIGTPVQSFSSSTDFNFLVGLRF